jgi:hypothetical protein
MYLDNIIDIPATQTTWTITDLTGGEVYSIEIQAYNKYGSSISSEALLYLASQAPDQVDEPIVTIYDSFVFAQWNGPVDNYSSVIGYQVFVMDSTDEFIDVTLNCQNQEWSQELVVTRECYLFMTDLIQSYGLAYMDDILLKVIAVNVRGSSVISDQNSIVPKVQDIPRQMLSCTQMTETSNTVVAFEW